MNLWLPLVTIVSCLSSVTVTANQNVEICPNPAMKRFRNTCIWAEDKILSHYSAEEKCKRQGGHLAMPKDFATQQFIKDLVHGGRYNSYWAGIRQVEDSKWVFMDYSVLGNFSYWAPKEPDGNENEDCVLLAAHVQTKWVTTQCHWGYRFICQLVDACDVQDLAIFYNLQIRLNFNNTEENTKLFSVGARVNVECAPGFVSLKGPSHLHCEIGGKWRNSTFCSKGCIAPNLPSTVRLLRSQPMYSVGDNLSLGCDSGHVLKGNLKCEDDGKWFGEAPACITINIPLQPRPNQPQIQCPKVANVTLFGVEEAEIKFVPMGTSIKLPCVKNVKIWPNGLWMRDQQVLVAKINIPTVSIHNNGTLIIGSMSSATEGLYTCIAFGSEQEPKVNYHSVRLILPRECNLKFDPAPTVHILSTHFVLLRCQVRGAIMSWFRKGRQVLNDDEHILLANSALLVRHSIETSGDYICRAEDATTHCRVERSVIIPVDGNIQELCGRARISAVVPEVHSQRHGKLVGGHVAPKGSHPWIVIFVNMINNSEKFLCGGNLINHRWVASAAHCFFWVKSAHDIAGLKAKLGKHDRTQSEAEEKVLNIDKMILHPDFDTNLRSFDNDIALIRLSERVTFSETIIPICLPAEGFVGSFYNARIARVAQAPHISGTVSGWGRLEEDGLQPKFLHQVRLPLVDYNLCKESTKQHVTENMFCAGYEQAVGDSCQGDSGGPFEMYVDGVAYLAGIVSWGEGCARPGTYGFYTKVENYRDFIAKHTGYDNDGKN